jgi:hypothetical protein
VLAKGQGTGTVKAGKRMAMPGFKAWVEGDTEEKLLPREKKAGHTRVTSKIKMHLGTWGDIHSYKFEYFETKPCLKLDAKQPSE